MATEGTIHIDGLRIYARHGVNPQERVTGNMFEVNLELKIDAETAMKNDSLGDTVNYAEIVDIVKICMAEPSLLLENAAYRIQQAIATQFPDVQHGIRPGWILVQLVDIGQDSHYPDFFI